MAGFSRKQMTIGQIRDHIIIESANGKTAKELSTEVGFPVVWVNNIKYMHGDRWKNLECKPARDYWRWRLIQAIKPMSLPASIGHIDTNGIRSIAVLTNIQTGSRDQLRELVRIRDGHTCQMCGKRWFEGQRRLDVHHLETHMESVRDTAYDRNNLDKMITLCHKCHLNMPHNRMKMRMRKTGDIRAGIIVKQLL